MKRSSTWAVVAVCLVALSACPPKESHVTIDGFPTCPGSSLSTEVAVKIDGPRASVFQSLRGDVGTITARLDQGETYELKAYKCTTNPCETPANLFHQAKLQVPKTDPSTITVTLPGAPECKPVAPPPAPEPAPAADAGG